MNKSLFAYITFTFSAVGITGVFFFFVFTIQNHLNHKKKIYTQSRHDSLSILDLKIKKFLDENHVGYSSVVVPSEKRPNILSYVSPPSHKWVYVLTDNMGKSEDIEKMAKENMYVEKVNVTVFNHCVKIEIYEVIN